MSTFTVENRSAKRSIKSAAARFDFAGYYLISAVDDEGRKMGQKGLPMDDMVYSTNEGDRIVVVDPDGNVIDEATSN
jgi:hypothetical protein